MPEVIRASGGQIGYRATVPVIVPVSAPAVGAVYGSARSLASAGRKLV
jgi:hypothetical protein